MNHLYDKTIIFLNLRFADFYSDDLFKNIKKNNNYRFVAILDQQFSEKVSEKIAPYLDQTYLIHSNPKMGFLGEFDYNTLANIIKKEKKNAEEIRIICSDEFNLLNAGRLRYEFRLPGHSDKELKAFRSKIEMKEILFEAGIRVPKFRKLEEMDTFFSLQKDLGNPFILKPIDSCGSHGVYLIHNDNEFTTFRNSIDEFTEIEVEEYISGKLYHVDSLIHDNELKFICANEYSYPNFEYTNGKVLASFPLKNDDRIAQRLISFAEECLCVLGANNIVNHMELFLTANEEIVFLEVSGRPPGAFVTLTHEINYGINLMDVDFCMQAGLEVSISKKIQSETAFFALFPKLPGKIAKLTPPLVQSRFDIVWYVSPGEVIHAEDCKNIVEKSSHAIFYNNDTNILRKDFEIIKNHKAIEVL